MREYHLCEAQISLQQSCNITFVYEKRASAKHPTLFQYESTPSRARLGFRNDDYKFRRCHLRFACVVLPRFVRPKGRAPLQEHNDTLRR